MFFGITRYSLFSPGSGSWKTSRSGVFKTESEYMEYLFSDARMGIRQHMFLERSVPVLADMAKRHDYRHFVLYSDVLPEHHKKSLLDACAEHPFLIPLEWSKPMSGSGITEVTPAMEAILRERYEPVDGLQPVVWFRLDDDDVLAASYMDRLEPYRRLDFVDKAVSFGLGLTAFNTGTELVNLREYYYPKSAQGLAFVVLYNAQEGTLRAPATGPHTTVDRAMPTILDSRQHMFFQMRHADQDSTLNATMHERIAESLGRLEKLPPLTASDIFSEQWPTVLPDLLSSQRTSATEPAEDTEYAPFVLEKETRARFDCEALSGMVEFEFEYSSKQRLSGQFTAISYHLSGPEDTNWSVYGLRTSTVRGLFRIASARQKQGTVRQTILIPKDGHFKGLTVRHWGSHTSPITITVKSLRQIDLKIDE